MTLPPVGPTQVAETSEYLIKHNKIFGEISDVFLFVKGLEKWENLKLISEISAKSLPHMPQHSCKRKKKKKIVKFFFLSWISRKIHCCKK